MSEILILISYCRGFVSCIYCILSSYKYKLVIICLCQKRKKKKKKKGKLLPREIYLKSLILSYHSYASF